MIGRCSKCKEMCEAELYLPTINGDKYSWQVEYLSNCCGAPLIDPESPERDEIETPGGRLPYKGPR